jgi:methylglutaconyl-CoA hydratase
MTEGSVLVTNRDQDVAVLTLNRPEIHNALDETLIAQLTRELRLIAEDQDIRAVVIAAVGKSFCAGADLNYMRRIASYTEAQNLADATQLGELLYLLDTLPKPTLALVQGPAVAGGIGLVCACDIVLSARSASFSIAEVRLGLVPAVISPYVINAIGVRHATRLFLTGERIDSAEAGRIGLVHEVVPDEALEARGETFIKLLLQGAPDAQREIKSLIDLVRGRPINPALSTETAKRIARVRASAEAKEGMSAFFEKRKPRWQG